MILRLSSNAHRVALVAASFAVAVTLSYFSIRNALAVHYATLQTADGYQRALHVIRDQCEDGHTDNALKVWDRLVSLHPRISLHDSIPLVGALMAERRIQEATRVWDHAILMAGLADLQSPNGSVLWDGGFESNIRDIGFSWLVSGRPRDIQAGIDTQEKLSGNRSLRLTFDGKSNIYFVGACHYLPVQPSTAYHFSAWVKARALTTRQGIRFQLQPFGSKDTSSVVTSEVHGTTAWTHVELPWSSANDVHEMQVCLVRFPSEEEENRIQGTAWVDDVALIPEAEHSKP